MNHKGQALVEFILIIPILLFLFIGTIEIGNLIFQKYKLENDLDTIVSLYQTNQLEKIETYKNEHNLIVNYQDEAPYITITIEKYLTINTPVIQNILKSPYKIETEKVLYNETE